jgi:AraC-like DNA-binding protein
MADARRAALVEREFDLVEQPANALLEPRARRRQRDLARGAIEEPQINGIFELANTAAHCGLREPELARGARETALTRHRHENLQLMQRNVHVRPFLR